MERENLFLDELNCSFFNPNWEDCSTDQNDPFESALSSMVSSPTASTANANHHFNGENIVLRELIGRLGSICNSGEVSPQQLQAYSINGNHSTNTSCYSTPLNSPTKIKLSTMENQRMRGNLQMKGSNLSSPPSIAPFSTDPGFAERAARFSCFANKTMVGFNELSPNLDSGKISSVSSSQSIKIYRSSSIPRQEQKDEEKSITGVWSENAAIGESMENSSLSEQIIGLEIGRNSQIDANSRKRKAAQKAKGKEAPVPESSETSAKRSKIEDSSANEKDAAKNKADANQKKSDDDSKPPEPPKDYIHVRARRGQATDAHSLAERVRREKISERMKFLQDLVPGCNKVTGKAVMLDEIINYVQSLQRQVEFLSMKLATMNPRMESNMETLVPKDMYQSCGSVVPHNIYPSYGYTFHSQPYFHNTIPIATGTEACLTSPALGATLGRNHSTQLPSMEKENYSKTAPQVWEDDLHSFVQMGFGGENQPKPFSGILPTTQMKVEQ